MNTHTQSSQSPVQTPSHGTAARATLIWLFLVFSTVLAWGAAKLESGGTLIMAMLFGFAFVKGALVILDYMAIRHAPTLWRIITIGWLAAVCLIIVLGYLKGLG